MNIIRKYKLSLLKYDILTEKELSDLNIIFKEVKYSKENEEVINFIYNNLFNLKQVKLSKYSIFYFKDDKFIFEHSVNSHWICFNYELIWLVFEDKFNYNYQEIIQLIKGIMKQVYKLEKIIPANYTIKECYVIEQIYKETYLTLNNLV